MMQPTLHRNLPAELQILPTVLRMMSLVGMREPKRNFYRFVLAFGWGFFIIHFPKLILGMGSTKINVIAKGLGELLFLGNLFAATLILVLNMTTFERLIQMLSEIILDVTAEDQPRDCYNLIREQTSTINKFARFYFTYCCFGPVIFAIPAVTTSYMRYFSVTGNGSEPVRLEPPMEADFYGLELRTDFEKYNFFLAISMPAYYVCSYLSVIKVTTLLVVVKYSSMMYCVVTLRIEKLAKYGAAIDFKSNLAFSADAKVKEVVDIVQLHNKALEITDLVEKIVNIPIAMQFFTCVTFWCLVMVYVSIVIDINLMSVMVPFWLSMIEMYGFSYLGTELSESAEAVAEAIYDLDWYNEPVQLQRYYQFILQRAQRETGVTAAKFFIVGRQKFMDVVRMSYSYYLVLKDVLNTL